MGDGLATSQRENGLHPIHTVPVSAVYAALQTRAEGLTQREADARLARYGRNTIREIKGTSLLLRLLTNFTHLMALLLWIGGLIAFIAQLPQLGLAIWAVIVINGVFSFWQEYRAEQATAALRRILPSYARVLREGQEQRILAAELVPGDIMLLAEGDHISADGRLIQESELRVDQSTLTGEAHPVRKTADPVLRLSLTHAEVPNLVFAGTAVATGAGKAVVFATGMTSEFGKIAHLTQTVEADISPLQREMRQLTKIVSVIAVGVGLFCAVLALMFASLQLAESFVFALGMIVAFVPEGLLPTVTLALAMGTQRMARRHALIKKLSAVETLGCTTVICTDKTGTLTENEMTVRELWVAGRRFTVTGVGYVPEGHILERGQPVPNPVDGDLYQVLVAAGLCNDAHLLPPNAESSQWTVLGDPTEAALQVVAVKGGINLEEERKRTPRVRELPFDSRRKCMSTIHRLAGGSWQAAVSLQKHSTPGVHTRHPAPSQWAVYVKGAPKEVLALCSHIRLKGETLTLDDGQRAEIIAVNDDYARSGLRVLAVAQRILPEGLTVQTTEAVEHELTFLGLVAMMDPPRVEVAEAVEKCHKAGIRIVMMTGDYGLTAESIARRIGVIQGPRPRIITGADLSAMEDATLIEALRGEVIFARVTPEHKLRVVTTLQEVGHIVAVTGDGVNDAPALKKADIGVAMGIAGTDVAKEAADMILTDDNFASIVNAVEEGRAVYANIRKFVSYIFTSNTPEAVPFILFALSGGRIPLALNVMQILSIDLATDMVPALALGAEPPEPGVMERPPRNRQEHVITPSVLIRAYLWLGMIQSTAAMAAFYCMYWTNGYWGQWVDLPTDGSLYRAATAMTLASVVTTQIGNLFAQRTDVTSIFRLHPFNNRLIWIGIVTECCFIAVIIYVPVLQRVFGTAGFPLHYWFFLFAWTPALLLADELRKALLRRRRRRARESRGGR
jgi:Ca2+-transporting ATPase